jgi:ABC-2 type transport system permease protein
MKMRRSIERIRRMLVKEWIQVRRDPRMIGMIILMPIVQTLVFGYAVTTDVRNVKTTVYDLDQSAESRDLISRFLRSGYFEAVSQISDDRAARAALDRGDAKLVLHIRKGFGDAIGGGGKGTMQLLIDGTDSNTAGMILGYASRIAEAYNRDLAERRVAASGAEVVIEPVRARSRAWFNLNLESRNFYVPGVVALLVTVLTLMLTSMAIVREKEIGTIEQIIVTPITRLEFIVGKTLPFAVIAFINVLLVSAVAVFWFDVPIRGSILLLLGATAAYLMTIIGVGLLISTVSGTQQQAMMTTFFFFFPAVLLSGFMFPIANMPRVIQYVTYLDPIRYFLVIIRGIFLKGIGPAVLWPQIAVLFVMGIATLALSMRAFRKTL